MMTPRRWLKSASFLSLAAVSLAAGTSRLHAQSAPPPPPHIDVTKFHTGVNDVVIPVPSEVFNALDKLGGNPNWAGQLHPETKLRYTKVPQIAMLMGIIIADGFIAVEAKDSSKVDEIGRRVIELSTALGVQKSVIEHCNAITDAAKADRWADVRSELDKTQHSVNEAMTRLNDQDAAELISIAGWLRGTDALSSLVSQDYQPDRADLLHQPDMLSTFEHQIAAMNPEKVQKNPQVAALREGLRKIKPLIDVKGNASIPKESVHEINGIAAVLVKSIAP